MSPFHQLLSPTLYLDPGSGSYLLQLLLAALLGAGFAIKIYWKKIVAFFRRTNDAESGQPVSPATSEDTDQK